MTIYRILLHYPGTLDVDDSGFIFSSREVAIKKILEMNDNREAYCLEEEGAYVDLLEEVDKDGVFYTKHCTHVKLD